MSQILDQEYFRKLGKSLFENLTAQEYLALDLICEDSQFIRFNTAKVRQLGTVLDLNLRLRLMTKASAGGIRQNSSAFTITHNWETDVELARSKLKVLRQECQALPIDPYAEIPTQVNSSELMARGKILDRATATTTILQEVSDLDFTGIYSAGDLVRAMADSLGQFHWFATTNFLLDYSIYGKEERSYKGAYSGNNWQKQAFTEEVSGAREKLRALENPVREIQRGGYRTYLAPAAVADLLWMLSDAPSEMAIRQGDSPLRLVRDGQKELSPLFSYSDDFRSGTSPRFNEQGELAAEFLPMIQAGKLQNTLISARTAKEFQLKANGASRGENLRAPVMASGNLKESEILSSLGEGLYISNLHYLNWSDQANGRITGMTRFACFWVEGGKLVAPIKNLRWDDSIFHLFGSELEAVTKTAGTFIDSSTYEFRSVGAVVSPGTMLRKMEFTL